MTRLARLGIVAFVSGCFVVASGPSHGQPGVTEKVTCENYFEKAPPAGTPLIKMYRYGNWEADPAKWTPTRVMTERVISDGKGGWVGVLGTKRDYPIPLPPKPPGPKAGTYGLPPGQPVPNGFTVDELPNFKGTKTHWRATLYGVNATKIGAKEEPLRVSAVQELVVP